MGRGREKRGGDCSGFLSFLGRFFFSSFLVLVLSSFKYLGCWIGVCEWVWHEGKKFGFGDETAMAFDSFSSIITTVLIFYFLFLSVQHGISEMRHECLEAGNI